MTDNAIYEAMLNKAPATQEEWLMIGIEKKWCSSVVCDSHDGLPRSDEEWQEWEDGGDPCAFVVRVDEEGKWASPH
jgi:hypothetical protein